MRQCLAASASGRYQSCKGTLAHTEQHATRLVFMQMDDWPALQRWTPAYLKKAFKGQSVLAGDYPMSFDNFLAYSQRSHDEMPLYLFDKHFAEKVPRLASDYKVGTTC